jgi:uncharacterized YigZ family protein
VTSKPAHTSVEYLVPAERISIEDKVVNSRFISTIAPAFTTDDAKEFIKEIKQTYNDATHNVPVYLIGHGPSVTSHSSDDGEPSGTAGRPALSVLQGSGLGDTVIVITRYFGGTKLGPGGLVKAYGDSVRNVIHKVPKARKIQVHRCELICQYPQYEQIKLLLSNYQVKIIDKEYTDQVTIEFMINVSDFSAMEENIAEFSRGSIQVGLTNKHQFALIPIEN